jgi:hypothetical protein
MSDEVFELKYHSAMPNWCKIVGLDIKIVPEWEGGGFMVRRDQAEQIVRNSLIVNSLNEKNNI